MKFRIGAKLGISAGLAVALVVAMIANQLWVGSVTNTLDAEVRASDQVLMSVLEGEIALRRIAIQNRTLQSATSIEQVDALIKRLHELDEQSGKAFGFALANSVRPENRQNLAKAKELAQAYVKGNFDYAEAQKDVIKLRMQQTRDGREWPVALTKFMSLPALATEPRRAELVRALELSDSHFKQARLVSWSRLIQKEEFQDERMQTSFTDALKFLGESRGLAQDPAVKDGLDKLEPLIVNFRTLVAKLAATIDHAAAISRDRADPARIQADEMAERVKKGVRQRAEDATVAAEAATDRAIWINIGAGAAILAVLIGSAVFAQIGIARPIRRIGDVLVELAGGNKQVDIPFTDRGDEVGDTARAANQFRDNLVRMEAMEAEQREAAARAAEESTGPRSARRTTSVWPRRKSRPSARRRCTSWPATSSVRSAASSTM